MNEQNNKRQGESSATSSKKDRREYYKEYNKKRKKDRRAYYREYNKKHPERLNRGFTKGYVNGNVCEGLKVKVMPDTYIIGYDEIGRPITNHPLSDLLRNKEMEWHDDDWCED